MPTRACNVCGNEFPRTAEHWHKQPSRTDSLSETCKACASARARAWHAANKERHRAAAEAWRKAHPESRKGEYERNREHILDYQHRYYDENAEEVKERVRDYAAANPEKISANKKRYHAENREVLQEKHADYYRRNAERLIRYTAEWRKKNVSQARALSAAYSARKRNAPGRFTGKDLERQSLEQKGLCFWCFIPLTKANFSIDHYIPLAKGGTNDATNIVLACRKCNSMKRHSDPEAFAAKLSRRRRS